MPTEEERRKATAARANRKALEDARVAHDVKVREPFKDYYRRETEALRRHEAEQRAAEIERRKQEYEAARLAKRRQRAAEIRAIPVNPEWRVIATEVVQRVPGVTVTEVLSDMAKVARGFTPNNWTGHMIWRMRNRLNRPNRGRARLNPHAGSQRPR